jgi:hypothetical protein
MKSNFYVYEHWRPDRGECFYVGKGRGRRANIMKRRNKHHRAIQEKLARLGMCVEVKIVGHGLSEDEAFELEKKRIAFWRSENCDLANMTDGGEGTTGHKPVMTSEWRAKLSAAKKGKSNYKLVMAAAAAKRGKPHTPEHRAAISAAAKERFKDPAVREKFRLCSADKIVSEESRKKMSEAAKARCQREKARALVAAGELTIAPAE